MMSTPGVSVTTQTILIKQLTLQHLVKSNHELKKRRSCVRIPPSLPLNFSKEIIRNYVSLYTFDSEESYCECVYEEQYSIPKMELLRISKTRLDLECSIPE